MLLTLLLKTLTASAAKSIDKRFRQALSCLQSIVPLCAAVNLALEDHVLESLLPVLEKVIA
jgi:hypothetical protein